LRYDLVIFGGGIAGVHASIAAARMGKKVLIVESTGSLGGMSTSGLVNPFMRYWLNGQSLVSGIFQELLVNLQTEKALFENTFDSELMRTTLHSMVNKEVNIDCLFNSMPFQGDVRKMKAQVITFLGEKIEVEADDWIDATGNASFAVLSGDSMLSGDREGRNQALTQMFVIGGVDFDKVREDIAQNPKNFLAWVDPNMSVISSAGYFEEIKQAEENALHFPNSLFFFVQLPGNGRVTVNTTHIPCQTTDSREVSRAVNTGLDQCRTVFEFAKGYVKGFENAYIEKIAPQIGIRENRRVSGQYLFSGEDVRQHAKFEDGFVKGCYGIDIHEENVREETVNKEFIPAYSDYYEIPIRSLISRKFDNLGFAGRCLSADFEGQSAARIMPTSAGMGQALGIYFSLDSEERATLNKEQYYKILNKITH